MRARNAVTLSSILWFAVCIPACSASGGGSGSSSGEGASSGTAATGTGGAGSGTGGDIFTNHGPIQAITISPPSAIVEVLNGTAAPASFQVVATFEDKTTGAVDALWSIDRPALGLITNTGGVFTASGSLGGTGKVTAKIGALEATATVTVNLTITQNPANLTPENQVLFDAPDATPSGALLYPYDKTVFARGLLAPEIMWSGGAPGDAYRVRLKQGHVNATIYTLAEPPSAFVMDSALWTQLSQSNAGEPVSVEVTRLSGGAAHAPMTQTWSIAQGSLRGSIYYWAVNTGQLMKIAPGAASPELVFDSGPYDQLGSPAPANYDGFQPPWSQGINNKRCVACHTVSKDGSTIAAVLERKNQTPSPWGTIDLTANPPGVAQVSPYDSQAIYLGITPDGAYAVHNDVNFTMHLANAKTGAPVDSALDGIVDKVADPAFSPDGKLLAFSSNVTGSYPVEFWRADVDVLDFDQATLTFSNRRQVVNGGTLAIAFPSFTPDSQWLVYQKGDHSRAKYGANQSGNDDLYVADVAGGVGELPLDAANGAGYLDAKNQHINYQPTVNPILVAGYSWIVFVSPRDYGNKMMSAANPTYENRKQLWVAAVDANPQPGKDPSHPAFWLPGQDLSTINMSGYWALEACKQEGSGCNEGFECCTGFCQPDANNAYVCVPPPGGCSQIGEKCAKAADCCDSTAQCIGGFCAQTQPN